VLDCNILVRCFSSRSPYHFIYQSLISNKFNLAITADILLEYEEVVQQKYSIAAANSLMAVLLELPNVKFVYPSYNWQLIEVDKDDNKYCDCSIAGQASYMVTEDRHFDVLKNIPFPSITVIAIEEFSKLLLSNFNIK
jgi:uncharacterized protein